MPKRCKVAVIGALYLLYQLIRGAGLPLRLVSVFRVSGVCVRVWGSGALKRRKN